MPIQIQGYGGLAAEVDGSIFRALRVTSRPLDWGTLGHYNVAVQTGAVAAGAAANSAVFAARWADATRFAVLLRCWINGMRATTAFAVGTLDLKLTVARSYSVSATGGTVLTLSGNNQKQKTAMGSTLFGVSGDMRVATTAALGAGTWTLDVQDHGLITTHSSAGVGAATPIIGSIFLPMTDLFDPDLADGHHPLVFAQNEGWVIRATVPATGVWNLGMTFKWAEVASF